MTKNTPHSRFGPPTFPLESSAFIAALKRGQGRVLQHILNFGPCGFESTILEAGLHDWAFDAQWEGCRAPWLMEIAEAAGLKAVLLEALINAVGPVNKNTYWDGIQRSQLLGLYAKEGHGRARTALYAMLSPVIGGADIMATEEIINLDGKDGLIFIARKLGQSLQEDSDYRVDDTPLTLFDEREGETSAWRCLSPLAETDTNIARYLKAIGRMEHRPKAGPEKDTPQPVKTRPIPPLHSAKSLASAHDILAFIRSYPPTGHLALGQWGKRANPEDREQVFQALIAEHKPEQVYLMLSCFRLTGLPRMTGALLQWLDFPSPKIRHLTAGTLSHQRDGTLRSLALRHIHGGDLLVGYPLLVGNYEPGDLKYLSDHLPTQGDIVGLHGIIGCVLDIAEHHDTADCKQALLFVYTYARLMDYRARSIRRLLMLNAAPEWLVLEAQYDADPDIRERVRAQISKP